MTLIVTPSPAAPAPGEATGEDELAAQSAEGVGRLFQWALWKHAIVLGLILVALIPLVGTRGQFSADEGAARVQAEHVANGDGWTFSHPLPAADPGGDSFPFELSQRVDDRYTTFGQHSLYIVLLAGMQRLAGQAGAMLLSIGGTVAAAVLTARIARRLDVRLAVPTLWAAGIASPLLFDGYLVIAHTLGATATAGAVLFAMRALDRTLPPVAAAAGVGCAIAVGVLLRTEVLLFAVALSVVLAFCARLRRLPGLYLVAGSALAAAATALVLDRWWTQQLLGGSPRSTTPLSVAGHEGLAGRVVGFVLTVLVPSYSLDVGALLRLVVLACAVASAVIARRRPRDREGLRLFMGVAVVAAVAAAVMNPVAAPGLLPAAPFLLVGLIGLGRLDRASPELLLAGTAVLFAGAVLATQYSSGGSGEWGWRYFAVGLPCVVPLCAVGLDRLRAQLDRQSARLAVACVCVGSVALSVLAVRTLHDSHRAVNRIVDGLEEATAGVDPGDGGSPVVLTTAGATARFAWRVAERQRWLTVPADDLETTTQRLRDLGVERVVVATRDADDLPIVDALGTVVERRPVTGSWWLLTVVLPK